MLVALLLVLVVVCVLWMCAWELSWGVLLLILVSGSKLLYGQSVLVTRQLTSMTATLGHQLS